MARLLHQQACVALSKQRTVLIKKAPRLRRYTYLTTRGVEMVSKLFNPNPIVYEKLERQPHVRTKLNDVDDKFALVETIDRSEIFDQIRDISDPEHPYTLEDLRIITEDAIEVDNKLGEIRVTFTPTSNVCPLTIVIGLCLRVKLMHSLPSRYKVNIRLAPGSHATEAAVNKQLNDKERVAAALENKFLVQRVEELLASSYA